MGKCVIALRNLVENAIKGTGAKWEVVNGRWKQTDFENDDPVPRDFEFTMSHDTTHWEIRNSAILPDQTYIDSFQWPNDTPTGIQLPGADVGDTSLSLRGAKLAQVLLDVLGFCVRIIPDKDHDGRHIGTKMIVEKGTAPRR